MPDHRVISTIISSCTNRRPDRGERKSNFPSSTTAFGNASGGRHANARQPPGGGPSSSRARRTPGVSRDRPPMPRTISRPGRTIDSRTGSANCFESRSPLGSGAPLSASPPHRQSGSCPGPSSDLVHPGDDLVSLAPELPLVREVRDPLVFLCARSRNALHHGVSHQLPCAVSWPQKERALARGYETKPKAIQDSRPIPVGTRVEVRSRFVGSWSRGFEIAGTDERGYAIKRLSDGSILPDEFEPSEIRAERRKHDFWWY